MLFMGGKGLWAKKLVAEIEPWRTPGDTLIEVCCGAANLTELWTKPVIAYDLNPALIAMWKAGQSGWRPPPREEITEELHKKYKKRTIDPSDPMTAFLLFGCSFRGVWAAGFARTIKHNTHRESGTIDFVDRSRRATIRKMDRTTVGVSFVHASYRSVAVSQGQVVYVDPPYVGRCAHGIAKVGKALTPEFDHADFWRCAREWSGIGARVFVSEESAPDDFIPYRSWEVRRTLGNWSDVDRNGPRKLEHLWVHRDSDMATLGR